MEKVTNIMGDTVSESVNLASYNYKEWLILGSSSGRRTKVLRKGKVGGV